MLLAMAFAARTKLAPVLFGIATASVLAVGLAVTIGEILSRAVSDEVLTYSAAALFIMIGVVLLARRPTALEDAPSPARFASVYLSVVFAFTLAEIGDKTMLMVITLAASQDRLAVYAGSALGMFCAAGLGAVFASRLAKRVNVLWLNRIAGVVFILVGSALAVGVLAVP